MKKQSFEYYLRNISRRWKKEIEQATEKVIVLSPYITPKTAEIVLGDLANIKGEIYTNFSVKNFISGASSLKTLKTLSLRGCQLYHLDRIHAKMIVIPGLFASIGSQNLTSGGVNNREASVIITDPQEVYRIEKLLEQWFSKYQPRSISKDMIEQVENILPKFRVRHKEFYRLLRKLNKEIAEIDQDTWSQEKKRIEAEKKRIEEEEKARQEKLIREQQWRKEIGDLALVVRHLFENGELDFSVAQEFISRAVIQKTKGGIRTSKNAAIRKNFYVSEEEWVFALGKSTANKFLVNKAVLGGKRVFLDYLDNCLKLGYPPHESSKLIEKLQFEIRWSVLDCNNINRYYYSSKDTDEHMFCFGFFGINVKDFIDCFLEKCNCRITQCGLLAIFVDLEP